MAYRGGSASIEQAEYWWYRSRSSLLRTILEPYVGEPELILDVGSADGPSVQWLRGRGRQISLDIDPRGLVAGSGVCGSATSLPFADNSFDVVGAFDVLEHCDPETSAMREFARVLKPGGRLLLSVPAYQWAWTDFDDENGHFRRYTKSRITQVVENHGLQVLRSSYAFAATFPFFVAERCWRKLRTAWRKRHAVAPADIVPLPAVSPQTDRMLSALSRLDAKWLGERDLAFGSSVVVAACKTT